MIRTLVAVLSLSLVRFANAQQPPAAAPPLLPEPVIAALAREISGDHAHQTVEAISRQHRMRGSRPFQAAAEMIVRQARAAGLEEPQVNEFPADGKICYGTQGSRPPWNAEFAE